MYPDIIIDRNCKVNEFRFWESRRDSKVKMSDIDDPTYYDFVMKSTQSLAKYISELDPER